MRKRVIAVLIAVAALSIGGPRVRAQNGPAPDWPRLNGETLRHFQALLRLDTQNPPGNEYLVTDFVKSVLEKEGIPVEIFASDPKRPNLVARLKGNGKKPPLLYMGHSDVVTVDPKKWTFPPFSATRDSGYIYGRGSLDDRPHVVAGLMTLLTLKRLNVPLDRDVIFLVESGEEGTTEVGIGYMASQHADAIAAEYCIAEGGSTARIGGKVNYAAVEMTEKLPRRMELVATGPSGHASRPLQGNAVVHLAAAVAAVGRWRVPVRLNATTTEFFKRMADIMPAPEAARYRALLDPGSAGAARGRQLSCRELTRVCVHAADVDLADDDRRRLSDQCHPLGSQGDAGCAHAARRKPRSVPGRHDARHQRSGRGRQICQRRRRAAAVRASGADRFGSLRRDSVRGEPQLRHGHDSDDGHRRD